MHRSHLLVPLAVFAAGCNCGRGPGLKNDGPLLNLPVKVIDFGPVAEGTQKDLTARVENNGRASMTISAMIETGGSADFFLGQVPTEVVAGGAVELPVSFAPTGAGSDTATLTITSNDADHPTGSITLNGGPIAPALDVSPDPVTFNGAVANMVNPKMVSLKSAGLSNLHVMSVGVDVNGNPDFAVVPPANTPITLPPDASVDVEVDYVPSMNLDAGYMLVLSDDPAGTKTVPLFPEALAACQDGLDNDGDGLIDFPDDPGCSDPTDSDEYNPPQCVNGAVQPCGSNMGACKVGSRTCANSVWTACDGGVKPSAEACDGVDNDCNGVTDDGITETCTAASCNGARQCVPDSGVTGGQWGMCLPVGGSVEMCDGVDNDCNGTIDDGISRACTINGCAGTQLCVPGGTGQWTNCVATNPGQEVCGDGVDNNCNGQIDEGCGTTDGGCNPYAVYTIDGGQTISYSCCLGLVNFSINQFQIPAEREQHPRHSGAQLPSVAARHRAARADSPAPRAPSASTTRWPEVAPRPTRSPACS